MISNKKSLLVLFLIVTSYSMQGQIVPQPQEKPFIEVTGMAEAEIVPDEIYIDITIQERYDSKAKMSMDMQERQLKTSLETMGINLKNLSLSAANAEYVHVKKIGKDVLTKKNFKLKLTDALTVGRLFEQLDKLDIDNAYISTMSHSKIDSIKKEIRIKAIKAAKEKADYLVAAIGAYTGKPLIIQEREYIPENPFVANARLKAYSEDDIYKDGTKIIIREEDVQLRMIKVQSTIFMKFLIE